MGIDQELGALDAGKNQKDGQKDRTPTVSPKSQVGRMFVACVPRDALVFRQKNGNAIFGAKDTNPRRA